MKSAEKKGVHVMDHPLIQHHLAALRNAETSAEPFRHALRCLASMLAYEAMRDLPVRKIRVRTPMAMARGERIRGRIGLVPILRAGLGMVAPVLDFLPEAEVWHLGFYRDESTRKPVEYYNRFPARRPVDVALVLDPMLATGGSSCAALAAVKSWGVRNIKLLSIIAAPEGLAVVRKSYPDVQIHVAHVDQRLNADAFILPGLGDAGDRQFNVIP